MTLSFAHQSGRAGRVIRAEKPQDGYGSTMSFSTGQPSALAIFSMACSSASTGWNSAAPPLLSMKALAALSEFQTTTGSGETPGTWTQTGTPSDWYTIANMASLLSRMQPSGG